MTVILASGSPRRRELLAAAGIDLVVRPAHLDETRPAGMDPITHARDLARRKAESVGAPSGDARVVGADTVVHRGDRLFDKPRDRDEAAATLRALAGDWHAVTTAVCVISSTKHELLHVTTDVRFRALSDADIARYVATGEADDKAGAYGIQGAGGSLVAEIRGSYTNVVGLPLEEVLRALRKPIGG
jgi:septum formation protein